MGFLGEQLNAHLRDAHAIAQLALPQLRAAPDAAGDPALGTAFRQHLVETEHHAELIGDRLEARGVSPLRLKNGAFRTNRFAFMLFRGSQPGTPGKLIAHALFHEHLEIATQELLRRMAARAGDQTTTVVAGAIREDERAMAERLEASLDRAVEASLGDVDRANIEVQLDRHLADAHAIEAEAIRLLERGPRLAGHAGLGQLYEEHLYDCRDHQRRVRERLDARGASPDAPKEAAVRLGALDWGALFVAQVDTPAKLAALAYAFEFLEVGCYEQLKRVARRAGDGGTERLAEHILADEREMAEHLWGGFDAALDAWLVPQEVLA
jgi:ferritin-like metal-binding protein YciE